MWGLGEDWLGLSLSKCISERPVGAGGAAALPQ